MRPSPVRRPGFASLDALLTTAVTVVLAAVAFVSVRSCLMGYSSTLGVAVGSPLP